MKINEVEWTAQYIDSLDDRCFAFIESGGKLDDEGKTNPRSLRHFPFKEKTGKIDLPHLKSSLVEASKSELGYKAMPKLKTAAKQMKIGEYAENWKGSEGVFTAQVQLTSFREQLADKPRYLPNDEKKEIVLPLLVEGWGNSVDNNYYTAKAVTESASYLKSKCKMYLNHPKSEMDDRDMRDWAASIQETWVDTLDDGRKIAMGRVKVLDNWLWERCKAVPDEIADSIIGRGKAVAGEVNGKKGNIIESIEYIKSCDFVDYAGNVPSGMVSFVENDKDDKIDKNKIQEEHEMKIEEITISMLKESRPELVAEMQKSSIAEKDKSITELEVKLKEQEKVNLELKSKLDVIEVKEKLAKQLAEKKSIVEKALKESKLPEAAKTEVFVGSLIACEESKAIVEGKEVVVTMEENIKKLIEDRASILKGDNPIKNMGSHKIEENALSDEQSAFNEGIFGVKKAEEKK